MSSPQKDNQESDVLEGGLAVARFFKEFAQADRPLQRARAHSFSEGFRDAMNGIPCESPFKIGSGYDRDYNLGYAWAEWLVEDGQRRQKVVA